MMKIIEEVKVGNVRLPNVLSFEDVTCEEAPDFIAALSGARAEDSPWCNVWLNETDGMLLCAKTLVATNDTPIRAIRGIHLPAVTCGKGDTAAETSAIARITEMFSGLSREVVVNKVKNARTTMINLV